MGTAGARTGAARCSVLILGALGACSSVPLPPPLPAPRGAGSADDVPALATEAPAGQTLQRGHSRWVPVRWEELPGWDDDRTGEFWPAFIRGCVRPAPGWAALCSQARMAVTPQFSDEAARDWLRQRLQPYRVESADGQIDGLATGYFEPQIEASRTRRDGFGIALYAPPADLGQKKPYWTRQQLASDPAAQTALRGRALAWVADPLDALILHIQGSGRLDLTEPNGQRHTVRLAFAAHNDQPYQSVGRWLIDHGELAPGEASWPGIKAWARRNPARVDELLWSNPRYVFFREEPLPDPDLGPKGAQAVPLTPGRSIAVDPQSIPFGTPVWLDTTDPLTRQPLRRAVMAQDTGTAIVGAVRADYFCGWGVTAEAQAGRMKQPLRMWVLWPKPPGQ